MKICTGCKIEKEVIEFGKKSSSPDGYNPRCKSCKNEQDGLNYKKNKQKILTKAKEYYEKNKEAIAEKNNLLKDHRNEYNRDWHKENRQYCVDRMKKWRKENKEYRSEYKKQYRNDNKDKVKQGYKDWLSKNPIAKLAKSCRKRTRECLSDRKLNKSKSFSEYIGCSNEELQTYITLKFVDGMTWDNYGKWHLDHIVPLASAQTEEQLYKLCHYTNLQPLWAIDNTTKNNKLEYVVKQIDKKETHHYLLNIHYAKRIPTISYAYGLFANNELVGVVTYGPTASPATASALIDPTHKSSVYELNRLCLKNNLKNEASLLVGRSLNLLPKGLIILSFADSNQDHIGFVYQATNFTYYGKTSSKQEVALKSKPNAHSLSIYDESKGQEDRIGFLKKKYGDDLYWRKRSEKHRYVYVTGKDKSLLTLIKYEKSPYPKKN